MTQHEFDRLSEKFLAGKCTHEEVALLRKWADLNFEQQSGTDLFQSDTEEALIGRKLWSSLNIVPEKSKRSLWIKLGAGIAASLLLGGFSLFFLNDRSDAIPQAPQPTASIQKTNLPASSKVTLPDGSTVILEEGADIVADKDFGIKDRKVILKGEAFFDVKPDQDHPFVVMTEDLVTEVLGTSFRIKPEKDLKKIEVSVVTGKVSIYTSQSKNQRKKNGVIAMPNQKVSYDIISKTLKQDLVDIPQPLLKATNTQLLSFDEVSVSKVLSKISDIYGVQFITGSPSISGCTFTGDLNGLDMYRQIEAICEVLGFEYEVRGTTVFISGEGCS